MHMTKKMAWLALVIGISANQRSQAQYWSHVHCALAFEYPVLKDSVAFLNAIYMSEMPQDLEPISDYDGIEYIFYSGNDWDYDTKELPQTWFQLKNLKGIILNNMTYEKEAFADARKQMPDLYLANGSACHAHYLNVADLTARKPYFEIEFIQNYRIPYILELEKLTYKSQLTIDDSVSVLQYFIENPVDSNYVSTIHIKNAANQWLGVDSMLHDPSSAAIDSVLKKFLFNEVFMDWGYHILRKRNDSATLDKICRMAIPQLQVKLESDAWYCQYSTENYQYCYKHLYRFIEWKEEGLLTPATIKQLQNMIDYCEGLRPH